jgi:hypothetical protein
MKNNKKEENLYSGNAREGVVWLEKYILEPLLLNLGKEKSKGFKVLHNYFKEVVKSDSFQERITELRKEHNGKGTPEFMKKIRKVANDFGLYNYKWDVVILAYLMGEKKYDLILSGYGFDLCKIRDNLREQRNLDNPFTGLSLKPYHDIENAEFPIAILISPYASIRNISDFIKKNSLAIKKIQEKYRNKENKIGHIKTKNPKKQERNQFIYDNRKNLSILETKRLVDEKFGECLDPEYIGKIRSMESRRRKKV